MLKPLMGRESEKERSEHGNFKAYSKWGESGERNLNSQKKALRFWKGLTSKPLFLLVPRAGLEPARRVNSEGF